MQDSQEPDWDTPLTLTLTPAMLIHSLFAQAQQVHTGNESCVSEELVVSQLLALDERTANHVRLVEQEYVDDEGEDDMVWHDWAVEVRVGDVWTVGHWQQPVNGSPVDWEWCVKQAQDAFSRACVLIGKQVRPGLAVVADPDAPAPAAPSRCH